jgi:hypothetical protein
MMPGSTNVCILEVCISKVQEDLNFGLRKRIDHRSRSHR